MWDTCDMVRDKFLSFVSQRVGMATGMLAMPTCHIAVCLRVMSDGPDHGSIVS